MLPLLAHLRVQRTIGPATDPTDRVLADKAYSSGAIRAHLRTRGIGSVTYDKHAIVYRGGARSQVVSVRRAVSACRAGCARL